MGVSAGANTLYHLTGLSRSDCAAVLRGIYEERRSANELKMSQPTIDGDSNNICYLAARYSSNKSMAVGMFYREWANCGLQITPVVDGDVRPTCKQATNKRIAMREKARVRGHILMKEAQTIKRNISNGVYTSPEELSKMKQSIVTKEKQGRSMFTQSQTVMPLDFAEALEDLLVNDLCVRSPNSAGGFVAPVIKAKFQADAALISVLPKRCNQLRYMMSFDYVTSLTSHGNNFVEKRRSVPFEFQNSHFSISIPTHFCQLQHQLQRQQQNRQSRYQQRLKN